MALSNFLATIEDNYPTEAIDSEAIESVDGELSEVKEGAADSSELSGLKRVSVPPPPPSRRPAHERPSVAPPSDATWERRSSLPPPRSMAQARPQTVSHRASLPSVPEEPLEARGRFASAPPPPHSYFASLAPSRQSEAPVPHGFDSDRAATPSELPPPSVSRRPSKLPSAPPIPRWISPDGDARHQAQLDRMEEQYSELRTRLSHEREALRVERRNNEELRHEMAVLRNQLAQAQRDKLDLEAKQSARPAPSRSMLSESEEAARGHLEHAHKRELEALKASYGRALRAQRANLNREMERLRTEHATEIERLKAEAAQDVKDQREAFEEAALLLRATHDEQVAQLVAAQSPDLVAMRAQFEEAQALQQRDYEAQLEAVRRRMKKAFDFALDDRHGTLMELRRDNAALRGRLAKLEQG